MFYQIVTDGKKYRIRLRYKWWPFWFWLKRGSNNRIMEFGWSAEAEIWIGDLQRERREQSKKEIKKRFDFVARKGSI